MKEWLQLPFKSTIYCGLSAWCVALCPSQQLWSCKNGQFTLPHFFMDKLDKVINQYFVHILSLEMTTTFLDSAEGGDRPLKSIHDQQSPLKYGAGPGSNSRH